jgi:hypothetical protein
LQEIAKGQPQSRLPELVAGSMPKGYQSMEQQTISRDFTFPGNLESMVAARESVMGFIKVPAASDGHQELLFATEVHRRHDVGHVGATRNQARAAVDHAKP